MVSNESGLAVVIGIDEYEHMPAATYAYNDAEVVREYLADTLGFSKRHIKLVTNSKATHAEFDRLLGSNGWVSRNVRKGESDRPDRQTAVSRIVLSRCTFCVRQL
mgnify:CR=1 FL=1